jgi:NAD(P)-dependent dehydrogenase (short-subunit alcohol dehydrogenase family)
MELGLKDQTAVIFGAAGAIGSAIAEAFFAEGAQVARIDRQECFLSTHSEHQAVFLCDVSNEEDVNKTVFAVTARFGPIRHVIYAAAVGSGKVGLPFLNLEPRDWQQVFRVNIFGAVNVAHAVAPLLIEQRAGSIQFLSSVAGQIGSQTDPPYSASKAALINFAQCIARDLAPHNVRVNSICPGMVDSPLMRSIYEASNVKKRPQEQQDFESWAAEKLKRVVPLERFQEPADIAAMSVFLASERGSNITGQTLNVDGGYVMHC